VPPIPEGELEGELRERLRTAEVELGELRQTIQANERELGRLHAIEERTGELKEEVERERRARTELEQQVDRRIEDAVKAALADVEARHAETVRGLTAERGRLQERIEELEGRLEQPGETQTVTPTELAGKFASVLDELAAPEPVPGKQFSAALTSLEVEARGVLEAPAAAEEEPRLRTGGEIDPAQLSTVRMSFRVLPHILEPPEE
jgi:DNA repair exonuclease SbcCD ATPase subunit